MSRPTKPEVAEAKTGMEKHPIQCTKKELEEMFEKAKNNLPLETLINGDKETTPPEKRWSFDKETLTIHNDNQWKGFFPADQNLAIQYLGGFWKRFYQEDGVVKGITHPVEVPFVYADSRPQIYSHPKYGEVVLLKYISPQNAMFYDVLKIVDKDTIVGKAFLGIPPNGLPLLTFSMSRKYGIERMAEEDHEKIFQEQAQRPPEGKVIGEWAGKLVSDGGLSPESQRFTFTSDKSGELKMRYIFARLLAGNSRVEMTPEQMNTYDWTNWHDEIKMVTDDLMVGKWCSPTTRLPLPDYAPGFLSVEKTPEGNRCSIRYILERK
ncbi:MAG: hypothetical protein HYU64_18960 [Armatimonadetes bacterium]|nr:hypothetical protein [Armatimonadota bacterium]